MSEDPKSKYDLPPVGAEMAAQLKRTNARNKTRVQAPEVPGGPQKRSRQSKHSAFRSSGPTPLSQLLIERRGALNLSQAALAAGTQHFQPWVAAIEKGEIWNLTYLEMVQISATLEVGISVIVEILGLTHGGLSSTAWLPLLGEGEAVVVGGVIRVVPTKLPLADPRSERDPAAAAVLADVEGVSTPGDPNFGWAAVGEVPIHVDDLPFADDTLTDPDWV